MSQTTEGRMTPMEQRVAIAEACGWKSIKVQTFDLEPEVSITVPFGRPPGVRKNSQQRALPDYLGSLDAMAEAEKTLTWEQREMYSYEVSQVIPQLYNCGPGSYGEDIMSYTGFDWITAAPAKRAEAFLKTVGKWKESK